MTNIIGQEIDTLHIIRTTTNYDEFYFACIDEGLNDDQIESFWNINSDFSGVDC